MGLFSKLFGKNKFGDTDQDRPEIVETSTAISNNSSEKIVTNTYNNEVGSNVKDTESDPKNKKIAIHSIVVGMNVGLSCHKQ